MFQSEKAVTYISCFRSSTSSKNSNVLWLDPAFMTDAAVSGIIAHGRWFCCSAWAVGGVIIGVGNKFHFLPPRLCLGPGVRRKYLKHLSCALHVPSVESVILVQVGFGSS